MAKIGSISPELLSKLNKKHRFVEDGIKKLGTDIKISDGIRRTEKCRRGDKMKFQNLKPPKSFVATETIRDLL